MNSTLETMTINRVFEAPVEKLWRSWAGQEEFMRWWGPKDFTCPTATIDFREGGTYLFCMRGPDGKDFWGTGTYREIVPMARIVYTDSFADADGNVVPGSFYGMGDEWPLELLVTLAFEEKDGKTHFSLRHEGIPGAKVRDMCAQSWNESFDKLDTVLAA